MTDDRHAYVDHKLVGEKCIPVAHCSCGWSHEGRGAGVQLVEHLNDCPDEVDLLPISNETEAWAERNYDERTWTLEQWKAWR